MIAQLVFPDNERVDALTQDELAVLRAIAEAWRLFHALPRAHPTEITEGATFVHGLQSLVLMRAAMRAYPDQFTAVPGFK